MHAGITNPWWWEKRSRHSRRMRNPQFYVSGKRPIGCEFKNRYDFKTYDGKLMLASHPLDLPDDDCSGGLNCVARCLHGDAVYGSTPGLRIQGFKSIYHEISNIRRTKSQNQICHAWSCNGLHWSHVLSLEWRCSWSSLLSCVLYYMTKRYMHLGSTPLIIHFGETNPITCNIQRDKYYGHAATFVAYLLMHTPNRMI